MPLLTTATILTVIKYIQYSSFLKRIYFVIALTMSTACDSHMKGFRCDEKVNGDGVLAVKIFLEFKKFLFFK